MLGLLDTCSNKYLKHVEQQTLLHPIMQRTVTTRSPTLPFDTAILKLHLQCMSMIGKALKKVMYFF